MKVIVNYKKKDSNFYSKAEFDANETDLIRAFCFYLEDKDIPFYLERVTVELISSHDFIGLVMDAKDCKTVPHKDM